MSEHIEQVALVKWFRLQYPNITMFAIPNGGMRNVIVATKLKSEGVMAGVSDLFIMKPSNGYHGMFIELKTLKGKLQPSQVDFIEKAQSEGYYAVACYGWESAKTAIKAYLD